MERDKVTDGVVLKRDFYVPDMVKLRYKTRVCATDEQKRDRIASSIQVLEGNGLRGSEFCYAVGARGKSKNAVFVLELTTKGVEKPLLDPKKSTDKKVI